MMQVDTIQCAEHHLEIVRIVRWELWIILQLSFLGHLVLFKDLISQIPGCTCTVGYHEN